MELEVLLACDDVYNENSSEEVLTPKVPYSEVTHRSNLLLFIIRNGALVQIEFDKSVPYLFYDMFESDFFFFY